MNRPLLALDGVTKSVGRRVILRDVSYAFEEGRRYLLVGANGSGKTTLLKIISSLMRATEGKVYYQEEETASLRESYLRKISFLSHQINMYEDLSGLENLEFFARLYEVPEYRNRALELLEFFGLKFFMNERVKNYSQGMRQRLAVAKAIIHSPTVLLFDEPFAGLDLRGTKLLQETIGEVLPRQAGLFILASHNPDLGWQLADHYLYLEGGGLASCGDRDEFEREAIVERLSERKDVGVY